MDNDLIAKLTPETYRYHMGKAREAYNTYLLDALDTLTLEELENLMEAASVFQGCFHSIKKKVVEEKMPVGANPAGDMDKFSAVEMMCQIEAIAYITRVSVDAVRVAKGIEEK